MNKTISKLLVTLTLLGVCLTDNTQYEGCYQTEGETCVLCFRSNPLGKGKGCEKKQPLIYKNCKLTGYNARVNQTFCSFCEDSLVLNLAKEQTAEACTIPDKIPDCLNAYTVKGSLPPRCVACGKNKYSLVPGLNQCVSAEKKTIQHCQEGGYFRRRDGFISCYRCEPGYALNSDETQCVTPAIEGCFENGKKAGVCAVCDVENGYYMIPGGKCIKQQGTPHQ